MANLKIVLADTPADKTLARMVLAAMTARETGVDPDSVQVVQPEELEAVASGLDPEDSLVLVVVTESELSVRRPRKSGLWFPCESLALAQRVARRNPGLRVFLARGGARTVFTGADVAAALLGGVTGIIDAPLLFADGVCATMTRHALYEGNGRRALLVGETGDRLAELDAMLRDWAEDAWGTDTAEGDCFQVAIALAHLDELRPLEGAARPFASTSFAESLNREKAKTGFTRNVGDLRRRLKTLSNRWLGQPHDRRDRVRLPELARRRGFPERPPAIVNFGDRKAARAIFALCKDMEIREHKLADGGVAHTVRLSERDFRHLPRQTRAARREQNGVAAATPRSTR